MLAWGLVRLFAPFDSIRGIQIAMISVRLVVAAVVGNIRMLDFGWGIVGSRDRDSAPGLSALITNKSFIRFR